MKNIYLITFICLALVLSSCANNPKVPLQVLTWEYIGEDCSRAEADVNDLRTLKRWLDFRNISLSDAKGLVMARIMSEDMPDARKRSLLAILASIEVNADVFGNIDEDAIFLTASEYLDYVIEAYEVAC